MHVCQQRLWRPLVPIARPAQWAAIVRSPSRYYTSQSITPARPKSKTRTLQPTTGTILFPNSQSTSTESLLSCIEPISAKTCPLHHQLSALLLFTPAFAGRLAYDHHFLTSVVNHLYRNVVGGNWPEGDRIETAIAVVDRLPTPSKSGKDTKLKSSTYRSRNPPVGDDGSEGMAYVAAWQQVLQLQSEGDLQPEGDKRAHEQQGIITMKFAPGQSNSSEFTYEVEIPLARTIFQAGQENILSLAEWTKSESGLLVLDKTASAPSISFNWPFGIIAARSQSRGKFVSNLALSAPLLPLTAPRKIESGMGNIIRQVQAGDASKVVMPASKELEAAVNSYFSARGLPAAAVSVWALVIPPRLSKDWIASNQSIHGLSNASRSLHPNPDSETQLLHGMWKSEKPYFGIPWFTLLRRGARLHRVLSGGGGWGQKAGLISLDPQSTFSGSSENSFEDMFSADAPDGPEGMLGAAAKVGHYVQFLITRTDYLDQEISEPLSLLWNLDVGTIPSMIDVILNTVSSEELTGAEAKIFKNHFGALSEKGIAVRFITYDESGTGKVESESQTKFDIPYSRLSAQKGASTEWSPPKWPCFPLESQNSEPDSMEESTTDQDTDAHQPEAMDEELYEKFKQLWPTAPKAPARKAQFWRSRGFFDRRRKRMTDRFMLELAQSSPPSKETAKVVSGARGKKFDGEPSKSPKDLPTSGIIGKVAASSLKVEQHISEDEYRKTSRRLSPVIRIVALDGPSETPKRPPIRILQLDDSQVRKNRKSEESIKDSKAAAIEETNTKIGDKSHWDSISSPEFQLPGTKGKRPQQRAEVALRRSVRGTVHYPRSTSIVRLSDLNRLRYRIRIKRTEEGLKSFRELFLPNMGKSNDITFSQSIKQDPTPLSGYATSQLAGPLPPAVIRKVVKDYKGLPDGKRQADTKPKEKSRKRPVALRIKKYESMSPDDIMNHGWELIRRKKERDDRLKLRQENGGEGEQSETDALVAQDMAKEGVQNGDALESLERKLALEKPIGGRKRRRRAVSVIPKQDDLLEASVGTVMQEEPTEQRREDMGQKIRMKQGGGRNRVRFNRGGREAKALADSVRELLKGF